MLLFALTLAASPPHAVGPRQWKRLRGFTDEQVGILQDAVGPSPRYVTLPHVLAEASNFLISRSGEAWPGAVVALQRFAQIAEEMSVPSAIASRHHAFPHLGLTDVAILLSGQGLRIVTGDGAAHRACVEARLDAVNVFHPLTPR